MLRKYQLNKRRVFFDGQVRTARRKEKRTKKKTSLSQINFDFGKLHNSPNNNIWGDTPKLLSIDRRSFPLTAKEGRRAAFSQSNLVPQSLPPAPRGDCGISFTLRFFFFCCDFLLFLGQHCTVEKREEPHRKREFFRPSTKTGERDVRHVDGTGGVGWRECPG